MEFYFKSDSVDPIRPNSYCTEVGVNWTLTAEWRLEPDEKLTGNITFQYFDNDTFVDMASLDVNNNYDITAHNKYAVQGLSRSYLSDSSGKENVTLAFGRKYGLDMYENPDMNMASTQFQVVFHYYNTTGTSNLANRMKRNAGIDATSDAYEATSDDANDVAVTSDAATAVTAASDAATTNAEAADAATTDAAASDAATTDAEAFDAATTDAAATDATTDNTMFPLAAGIALAFVQDANSTNNNITEEESNNITTSNNTVTQAQEFDNHTTITQTSIYHTENFTAEHPNVTNSSQVTVSTAHDTSPYSTVRVSTQGYDDYNILTHAVNLTIPQPVGESC